jgi:ATP-dependent DNA helicase RecQ
VHGIGHELDRSQWRTLVRQLTGLGYLQPVPDGRGGLQFGPEALVRPLLRGEETLELPLPPPRKERRRSAAGGAGRVAIDAGNVDASLVEALKRWRRQQASEQGVPPYVVFHDRTLLELAERRPASLAQLAGVSGIGAAKLERYGEALLAVLAGERDGNSSP